MDSGEGFRIRDGIPLLLDESKVTGFNQRYQGVYNKVAEFYDAAIKLFAYLAGGGEAHFRGEYLRELEVQDGDRVLEVSVGTGANLHYLPVKATFLGVDLSWGMLKRCQKNLKRRQIEAELILGNAEELPLCDESFDTVLHVGGINAFNDPAKAISEMIRVARAGAKIVIVDETAKMMESLAWMPSVRRWLQEHSERFSASKLSARVHWGTWNSQEIEGWGAGIRLLNEWGFFDRPEPRLALFRWMAPKFPSCIVYSAQKEEHEND